MKSVLYCILSTVLCANLSFSKIDSIEVYLIDAYATPELPHTFKLSFFTSDACKSRVMIENDYEYIVAEDFTEDHNIEIELTGLSFNEKIVDFVIITEDGDGNYHESEIFDFDLPYEPEIKEGSNLLTLCLFGGAVFLLPYPGYVNDGSNNFFSLTKEIPLISFRSKSYRYPAGYLSLEYTHIFETSASNFLRAGYKQIYELPQIEYISPGISLYTNFLGNSGISPEVSVGIFTIVETFTFYTRYRYNIKPGDSNGNFHEINLGLYSAFFSFYPD